MPASVTAAHGLGALLVGAVLTLGAAPLHAQTVAALVGDDRLAHVDVASRKVAKTVTVTGAGGRLLGIDVRPADGRLYALVAGGRIVTIDPDTGVATQKAMLEKSLGDGVMATVDFNPVADRLRIIGSDGTNLRANVDDGKVVTDGALKFAETDAMKGRTPRVVAGAYTNSVKGAKETTLFDIGADGAVLRQAPPNDGVLNTIGMLGIAVETAAFDVAASADGRNVGYLMAGPALYRVDLASGAASPLGPIAGVSTAVRDIAVLP